MESYSILLVISFWINFEIREIMRYARGGEVLYYISWTGELKFEFSSRLK